MPALRDLASTCAVAVVASILALACRPAENVSLRASGAPDTVVPARAAPSAASPLAPPRVPAAPGPETPGPEVWTFAVLSDLHVRPDGAVPRILPSVIRAAIATRPRFVAIIGDFTFGQRSDPLSTQRKAWAWWRVVRRQLEPFRVAGIPVLPLAGNHDSDLHVYRKAYADAWSDLERWAAPLPIRGKRQPVPRLGVDAAPFTYSTEVDGVHMTFAHVVSEKIDAGVLDFVEKDLAAARAAPLRLFFGHVPLVGIGTEPRREFGPEFARMLESVGVDVYVAGHEHVVWDEDFQLPGGALLHQVVVGTASALWRFGPNAAARRRAHCTKHGWGRMRCRMPRGGLPFDLRLEGDRWLQTQQHTFTLFTVEGQDVTTRTLAVDRRGAVAPFGIRDAAPSPREARASEAAVDGGGPR